MKSGRFDMEVEYKIDGKIEVAKIERIPLSDIHKHLPIGAQVVGAIAKRVNEDE